MSEAKHSNETLHESDDQAWSEDYESEDENNRSDIWQHIVIRRKFNLIQCFIFHSNPLVRYKYIFL